MCTAIKLTSDESLPLPDGISKYGGREVTLGLRPEHIIVTEKDGHIKFKVEMVEELGADSLVHGYFGPENTILAIRVPGTMKIEADMNLQLTCEPQNLHLFDPESGNRLEA